MQNVDSDLGLELQSVCFHPQNDDLLLVSWIDEIFFIYLNKAINENNWNQSFRASDGVLSLSFLDSEHLIVTTRSNVITWKVSRDGILSDGKLVLSHSQVTGRFYQTFVSPKCLLCELDNEKKHRFYPLLVTNLSESPKETLQHREID